jgi:glycosyltransferase involved in cell wall biosynthesis
MRVVLTRREGLDSRDGVSIFIVSLAQALVELSHDVMIVVGSLRSQEYQRLLSPRLDLRIHALSNTPPTGFGSVRAWLRAKGIIDSFRPDLVLHSEAVPIPMRGTIIQVVHDLQPRTGRLAPLWRSIRRFSFKRCDHVVATTTELRNELARDLGMPQSLLSVIPKCIDRQAYQGLDISRRERAILHAGTLPYKNPAASIRAFGVIDDPSVRLYITGSITAPAQEAVRLLPDRLRDCVTLVGEADGATVRGLHNRIRVAAFPTLYAVPVASATVMEAIAAGTPIVGSERLSRDVLVDGENGLVVDTSPLAMAAACKAVLNDDALWLRLSAGAGRMVQKFDAFQVAEQYLSLALAGKGNRMTAADRGFEPGGGLTNEHNVHLDHAS